MYRIVIPNVKNRIAEALDMRGLKQVDLVNATGIHKATISNYLNQKYQPKQNTLVLMAKYLNVDELWLAGYDVPMERKVEKSKERVYIDVEVNSNKGDSYKRILAYVSKIKEAQLPVVEAMLKGLTEEE